MEKKEIKLVFSAVVGLFVGYILLFLLIGLFVMHMWAKEEETSISHCMQKTGYTYEQCESAVVW